MNYRRIKESLLFKHVDELAILPKDLVTILIEYTANYTEKYLCKLSYGAEDDLKSPV